MGDFERDLQLRYGLTMTIGQVAAELKLKPKTIYNRRSQGNPPVPFSPVRPFLAKTSDVAAHLEGK